MNLSLLLEMAVAGYGSRTALGPSQCGLSFAELRARAAGGATVLGDQRAEQLVFIGTGGPAYPQAMFSAAIAGVPFVPLNYRLSAVQIQDLLGELGNSLVVADSEYLPLVGQADVQLMSTGDFVRVAASATPRKGQPASADATAVILFTSGTTARPKAVLLKHENLMSYIISTVEFGNAGEQEAALITVPPYHVAAVASTLSNIYSGRRVVHLPDFDPAAWLRLVADEGVTSAMLVPTMLSRVVDLLDASPADLPTLRAIAYGGARMPQQLLKRALRMFPDVGFVNAYGLTETSSTIAILGAEDHREAVSSDDPAIRRRLGSVGRPVPGIEVQLRDEFDQEVGPGQAGALWVRGSQVAGEYHGQGSTLDADGWFCTRDRCYQDTDGYLFIEGRLDDTIIRGAENIAPAEIEDALLSHEAVKDVAVVGLPDAEWGETVCAVVVRERGTDPTADELKAHVRGRLRGSRTPDAIVWRDVLPHSPTGKLLRRQLRTELAETSTSTDGSVDGAAQARITPAKPGVHDRSYRRHPAG